MAMTSTQTSTETQTTPWAEPYQAEATTTAAFETGAQQNDITPWSMQILTHSWTASHA